MDFEPNKESFLERMKAPDFNPLTLAEDVQALREILWYVDEERTREIAADILTPSKTSRADAEQIITNLAKLYPLSRALVMKIMSSLRNPNYSDDKKLYRDAEFLDGFDAAKILRDEIVSTFNEVENRIFRLTKEVQEYKRTLANLKADRVQLERQAAALRTVAAERDQVQAQVNQLRIDTDENKLRDQLEELRAEKNHLEATKADHLAEIEKQEKSIRDVKAELKDLQGRSNSDEEIRLIKELFKKFPNDAEDGR